MSKLRLLLAVALLGASCVGPMRAKPVDVPYMPSAMFRGLNFLPGRHLPLTIPQVIRVRIPGVRVVPLYALPGTVIDFEIPFEIPEVPEANSLDAIAEWLNDETQPTNAKAFPLIAPLRRIDWTKAGATITNRTTICTTAACNTVTGAGTSATAAQINAAIASAGANEVVKLTSGTYTLSAGLVWNDKSNVTLRGDGPHLTFLIFNAGDGCGGLGGANICIKNGSMNYANGGEDNTALWSGGYARGNIVIKLNNKTNLVARAGSVPGTLIILDQQEEGATDPGLNTPWVCGNHPGTCSQDSRGGPGRTGTNRLQMQVVEVIAIEAGSCTTTGDNLCDITISPGLYHTNWNSARNPGAWWSNDTPVYGNSVEELSIQVNSGGSDNIIRTWNGKNNWFTHLRTFYGANSVRDSFHYYFINSLNNTVQHSYLYNSSAHESESGGMKPYLGGDHLFLNNIFQWVTNPQYTDYDTGSVFAYNYSINHEYGDCAGGTCGVWMLGAYQDHGTATSYNLSEGNDGLGFFMDANFGAAQFLTSFRNRWRGWEDTSWYAVESGSPSSLHNQTAAVMMYFNSRYVNLIANVLGVNSWHNGYEGYPGNEDPTCKRIYAFGFLGNCDAGGQPTDSNTRATSMRWGNYDTFNDAVRWEAGEVPTGIGTYANTAPFNQKIPPSLFLKAKPTWWPSVVPWPPIGPDVTGGVSTGDDASTGGHVHRIPARRCYEDQMGGTMLNSRTIKTFNPGLCGY